MAEIKQTVGFDTIMRDLRAHKYLPVYVLMGENAYYIDKISDYIAENVLNENERDFNLSIVYGSDVSAAQVADIANRYPMMAEHQVVIVKEAQNIKKLEPLEKYFEKPSKSTILVLCFKGEALKKVKFLSKAKINGLVFESKKVNDSGLIRFIELYLKERGATIDKKSSAIIADHIGSDLSRMASELDKVLISLPESNKQVTPEIVEQQIGVSKDFNLYELKSAIATKNLFKANQIIKYFDSNPKSFPIYKILPSLFYFFQDLMIAYYAPQKRNENDIAAWLDMRYSWTAKDIVTGMRNYSGKKTLQIIYKIREIDAKSKGLDNPNTGSGDLMKELIFFILH
jgi:DNA polymerase-3 subunit delta